MMAKFAGIGYLLLCTFVFLYWLLDFWYYYDVFMMGFQAIGIFVVIRFVWRKAYESWRWHTQPNTFQEKDDAFWKDYYEKHPDH